MIPDLLRRILDAHKKCPDCGAHTFFGQTYCPQCGERIRNRNPLLRFIITLIAIAIIGGVVWWKLKG